MSEESDSNPSKDLKSNPTSDCESVKKEEHRKKVSRYSERRSEKRNKDKSQKTIDSETEGSKSIKKGHELRKSVSNESSAETKDCNSAENTLENTEHKNRNSQ